MKPTKILMTTALSAVLFALPATAADVSTSGTGTDAGPEAVEVDEMIIVEPADAPTKELTQAHESFLKKDWEKSAAETRKAAAFMKREAARAKGETKEALNASATDLEKLADRIEAGTVTSVNDLDRAFARAHQAVAQSHYIHASEAWTAKKSELAGTELQAAASHVRAGIAWSGHKAGEAGEAALNDADAVGKNLQHGTSVTAEEVSKSMDAFRGECSKLGQWVKSF
jgi:hypothetical protein